MKKFFLMLAVALPMFFMASCGDDNDDETIFERDVEYSMPVLTKNTDGKLNISSNSIRLEWGDDASDVRQAMSPFSYVYNTDNSTAGNLVYTYDNDITNYPWYIFSIKSDGLAASSIFISEIQDEEVDFEAYFKNNGYKDVSTDDDDDFVYRSKDKLTLVHYGYDEDTENVTVVWVPNVDGTRADALAVAKAQLELVQSIVKK